MYRATGDEKYLSALGIASTGLDWSTVGDYGNIALITMNGIDKSSSAYTNAKNAVLKQADKMAGNVSSSPYGSSITTYNWGSNMTIANAGIIFGLAQQLTGDASYGLAAQAQLNYLLGTNPVATSFVSGYGTVSPENPHHRPSMAVGHAMKGMLAGGVNENLEDSAAKAYCNGLPAEKCFVDNSESYSTNEITIYWNSPLTYLLSLTDDSAVVKTPDTETTTTTTTTTTTSSETTTTTSSTSEPTESTTTTDTGIAVTLAGDANCDGVVSVADAVLIMQSIANPSKFGINGNDPLHITAQGNANGDVNGNGNGITNLDALAIQKYRLGLLDKLPEA